MRRSVLILALALACGGEPPDQGPDEGETTSGTEAPGDDSATAMVLEDDPHGEAVVAELLAIETRVLRDWEQEVRAILLRRYDTDQSGSLDSDDEIHRIVCEVWRTLDAELDDRSTTEDSLREAYGFAPDQLWQGVLGIDVSQREHLRTDLLDCGVR